jgi:ferredoxin-NADP reductase
MLRRALATATHSVTLLYATAHSVYGDELAGLAALEQHRVDPARVEDEVRRRYLETDADRSRQFFVCGVGDVVPRLRDALRGGGYARRAVQYEKW